ncbi:cyclin-like protein [Nitzschia inconspicua]|uniref:Cyclin-like protein n=1 Tax=Nitzschia inconspicua TaxID=303405 RepID=A0A9K3M420_9STRA|nr:cyclin-like protein [Nitzschia inconspicua]KAG7342599.1 cyclin-like protein [Nitzschia inconspicua]KAG7371698.1 cyclin-like protein [Nitzschia inconspicua]KAG7371701.1 cyclin-like protein [Nitzschia inconspicua]
MTPKPAATTTTPLTKLDRTVQILLNDPDKTASQRDGISARIERLHRWHGVSLIRQSCGKLQLGPSVIATAATIFHRYYHQVSLHNSDVWSVAMACTLLATKLEEQPKTIFQIVHVYAQLYADRLIGKDIDSFEQRLLLEQSLSPYYGSFTTELSKTWNQFFTQIRVQTTINNNANINREDLTTPSSVAFNNNKHGPVYQEWSSTIHKYEHLILRQLGFTLYWIPNSHPHTFLLYFCQVLEWRQPSKPTPLTSPQHQHQKISLRQSQWVQCAWNYCNDACCYLDVCTRYPAEVVASAAILLTSQCYAVSLPQSPVPWWHVFVGQQHGQALVDVANVMAGLSVSATMSTTIQEKSHTNNNKMNDTSIDWLLATKGFVRSLVTRTDDHETSFNDPNSFLWEYQKEVFEKKRKLS